MAAATAGLLLASPLLAATYEAPHATRIILLGTEGGPAEDRSRAQPANLLVVDGKPYLIDAGADVAHRLVQAGYAPEEIGTIFITHHHIDHNAGLESLISFIWFGRAWNAISLPPVDIYGPPATRFIVKTALAYLSVSERIFRADVPGLQSAASMFKAHDIEHGGVVFEDQRIRVTAAENTHYRVPSSSPVTGPDMSYSYRFDTPAGSVVFTGDTGPSDAVAELARGADVLVSEVCTCREIARAVLHDAKLPGELARQEAYHLRREHLTPEEVGRLASRAHVKLVVLTHLVSSASQNDHALETRQFTEGVHATYRGPVVVGKDLFEYDLYRARAGVLRGKRR